MHASGGDASRVLLVSPPDLAGARRWIYDYVLSERLGLNVEYAVGDPGSVYLRAMNGRVISIPDVIFGARLAGQAFREALTDEVALLPDAQQLFGQGICRKGLPVLAGSPRVWQEGGEFRLGWDLLGACFALLSKCEEWGATVRDEFRRFDLRRSHAATHGYLDRPLADEYIELLRTVLVNIGVQPRAVGAPRFQLSCDVDFAFHPLRNRPVRAALSSVRSLMRLEGAATSLGPLGSVLASAGAPAGWDPNVAGLAYILRAAEERGEVIECYFIPVGTHPRDGEWTLYQPSVRAVMTDVSRRGHRIGMHPGFMTMDDADCMRSTASAYVEYCGQGVASQPRLSRQRYLRFRSDVTPALLDAVGVHTDSSLGGAWLPGFVAGTCHGYPLFDAGRLAPLKVREQPLILMDAALLDPRYMKLPASQADDVIRGLASDVRRVGGTFTVLWHNSRLASRRERQVFDRTLEIGASLRRSQDVSL